MTENLIGSATALFPVRLSTASTDTVEVQWQTQDGSAIGGIDYKPAKGVAIFSPGETEKQIEVIVYGQTVTPAEEKAFFIRLAPPTNAVLVDSLLTCLIHIDDSGSGPVLEVIVPQGKRGFKGEPGMSSYDLAVQMGLFDGTIEEWMAQEANAGKSALRAEQAAVSANIGGKVYSSPSAGVNPNTGVKNGEYFNVRSPNSTYYVDEYLNSNGTAVSTGKSYPSAKGLENAQNASEYSAAIAEAAAVSATIGSGIYQTPEAGVNPVGGVPAGGYYNVRSSVSEHYVDEYRNVAGVPTATGKSYLSAYGTANQAKPANTIFDASGKTQQEINNVINSKYVSVDNYSDITTALNEIRGTNAILLLNDSAEYTIDSAVTQFFSQIETNGNRAKITVTDRTKLSTFGEDLYLKNIVIIQAGKRVGIADNTFSAKYLFDYGMPAIDNSIIEDIDCYAVTNTADLSSYVDDTGKTRGAGFANIKVTKSSVIKNLKNYGYRGFIALESVNSSAVHIEDNIVGYNCETNIYIRQSNFQQGSSRRIGIKNTATQKTYWCGMSSGIGTNGKAALMSEADHAEDYVYEDIWSDYAIEKPCYVQSKKSSGFNIRAYNCLHAGQAKHNKGVQDGTLILRDNIAIDSTSLTGIGAINGFSKAGVFNQAIENSVKNKGRALVVYNVGDCVVDGFTVKNAGVPITIGGESGQDSGKLTIRNAVYDNCFSDTAAVFERFNANVAPNPKLTTLVLDNNSAIFPQGFTATSLPIIGADFKDVLNIEINKSNWSARGVPFKTYSDLNSVKISDSVFDIHSVNNMYNSFTALISSSYELKANTFDCTLNIKPTDTIVEFAKFHCLKNIDTGLTYVSNSWSLASLNLAISTIGSTNIFLLGAGRSLSISAESGSSKIYAIYDASTKVITSIYNVGSVFSTVKADNKVCINVDSSNRVNIDVGNGLTWTQGAIKIKLNLN